MIRGSRGPAPGSGLRGAEQATRSSSNSNSTRAPGPSLLAKMRVRVSRGQPADSACDPRRPRFSRQLPRSLESSPVRLRQRQRLQPLEAALEPIPRQKKKNHQKKKKRKKSSGQVGLVRLPRRTSGKIARVPAAADSAQVNLWRNPAQHVTRFDSPASDSVPPPAPPGNLRQAALRPTIAQPSRPPNVLRLCLGSPARHCVNRPNPSNSYAPILPSLLACDSGWRG